MAKAKLVVYYDIVSPFGYLAYYLTRNSPVFKQCDVSYVPIFLGGVMKACGNRPPLEIKNKDKWIDLERRRWAQLFDIPITDQTPDGFPVLTLATQRALTALTLISPEKLEVATDALYKAMWVDRNVDKVNQPDGMAKILGSVLGSDVTKQVLDRHATDEVKKLLNKRGEEAVNEGAFGVPFFVATNAQGQKAAFWGFDHFGQVTLHLGLDKPRARDGWQAML